MVKNVSTGFGLCVLGLGIAAWPVLDRLASTANASAVPAAASAISAAASAQAAPTIVWYGMTNQGQPNSIGDQKFAMIRAWSNGLIEARRYTAYGNYCPRDWDRSSCPNWEVLSDPAQGYAYRSDINFDEKVDGADLGALLADWGNAPRQDIPPSDCPLNLVNP